LTVQDHRNAQSSAIWGALANYLLADDPAFEGDAERLAYVLSVPVSSLRPTLDTLEKAEAAIYTAFKIVRAYVEANQTEGDLSVVQSFGQRLFEVTEGLQAKLAAGD